MNGYMNVGYKIASLHCDLLEGMIKPCVVASVGVHVTYVYSNSTCFILCFVKSVIALFEHIAIAS